MENSSFGARVAPDLSALTSRQAPLTRVYASIVRWSILILVVLLPLFFLTVTTDVLEINKQTLLVLLTFVAALAWLGLMVNRRELTLRRGWFNAFPVFLWLAVFISSILSQAPFTSWIGQNSQEYTSFLTTTAFVILFYLLVNTMNDAHSRRTLAIALIIPAAVMSVILLLQVFGLQLLAFAGITSPIFNTVGTLIGAALYLLTVTLIGNGLWLTGSRKDAAMGNVWRQMLKVATFILSLSTILLLITIDYWVLWVVLLVGLVILFTFSTMRAQEFPETGRFILPMGLMVVSLLLLFLPTPLHTAVPVEVTPSISASWSVATKTLSGSSALFGTGPGTYAFDYVKERNTDLNSTNFWNVRFDRGGSHLLTLLPTLGIVGLIALFALVIAVGARALHRLVREHDHTEWKELFVFFPPWFALVVATALYPSNLTLSFLFWLLTGLLAGQVMQQKKSLSFNHSPRAGLTFSFLFVLVSVAIVTGLFVTGQRYTAEIAFAQAAELDRQGGDLDLIIKKIAQAGTFNRLSDEYNRNLGKALLVKLEKEIQAAGTSIPPEKIQYLQQLILDSINTVKLATELSPNNVANWEMLGAIYREVSPLVAGADALGIEAIMKSIELDPSSPAHLTELGQAYIVFSENARALSSSKDQATAAAAKQKMTDYLAKAEEALLSSIALKADYAPAHYYLGVTYEREGRLADAINKLEAVKKYNPLDVGVAFQLGLLYLRQGNYDLAQVELERAIQITPNYANARWFLAAIYEQKGMIDKAIEQVNKVLELNPDNELVKAKWERLQAGETSNEIPEPVEPVETTTP